MKVLSIGKIHYDRNILIDNYPAEGTNNITKEMISCCGGSANVVAYALGKWNMESFISAVVGYDDAGNSMKKNMEENKVKTTYLETNYDVNTPNSYILINKQNNKRTTIKTEIDQFNIKKFEYDTAMDCVITDGYEYNATSYAMNKFNTAVNILNAKTPHQGLIDYFKYVKYVVCGKEVAEAITGLKLDFLQPITLTMIYKKIIEKYPHIVLFILLPNEGVIYSLNNEIKVLASLNIEEVDATGAEDIFVAMLGYGITNGYDIETTLKLATIAEGLSKKTIGATYSIPLLSEIVNFYENRFGKLNIGVSKNLHVENATDTFQNMESTKTEEKKLEQRQEEQKEAIIPQEEMLNPFSGTILNEEIINHVEKEKDNNAPTT